MRRSLISTSFLFLFSALAPAIALPAGAASFTPTSGALTGDFNGDGFADLASGVAGDRMGSAISAGNVIYGSGSGLTAAGNQIWSQNSAGILGVAEKGDQFGFALAVGDFNGDGFSDLAVGVPREGIGSTRGAGAVNVIYGSASGLSSSGTQLWSLQRQGVPHRGRSGDN